MILNDELIRAFAALGVSMQQAATAFIDFNAAIVRLADGRSFTMEEIENARETTSPPFRRIRL